MSLQGRRVVVLVEQQYEDLELWYPKLRLLEEGAGVVVAGTGESSYPSKHGYPAHVDEDVAKLDPADFDGVVVPGGWAPDYLRRHPAVTDFVRAMDDAGKLVAAICHGGSVLVSAGILNGRQVTSVPAIRDDLTNAGASWVDAQTIIDRNLVTARRPADLPDFLPAIIAVLEGRHREQEARVEVEGKVIGIRLERSSFEYMLDMLGRLPSAKEYHGEGLDSCPKDEATILADYARETNPRGGLEAETPAVVEVRRKDDGYLARGNERLYQVLSRGEVPGIQRV